jgi:hypothetical protein
MGQEEIIISLDLQFKLDRLSDILYDKEYFGFRETAKEYVSKIYEFIYNIPKVKQHVAKKPKYGKYYAVYKPAKSKTNYYITFNKKDDRYVIKNIITNHTKEYPAFIKGIK